MEGLPGEALVRSVGAGLARLWINPDHIAVHRRFPVQRIDTEVKVRSGQPGISGAANGSYDASLLHTIAGTDIYRGKMCEIEGMLCLARLEPYYPAAKYVPTGPDNYAVDGGDDWRSLSCKDIDALMLSFAQVTAVAPGADDRPLIAPKNRVDEHQGSVIRNPPYTFSIDAAVSQVPITLQWEHHQAQCQWCKNAEAYP